MKKYYLWFVFVDFWLSAIKFLLGFIGVFIIPIALPFAKKADLSLSLKKKQLYEGWEYKRLPKIFWIWDNPDYGIQGNEVFRRKGWNPIFYKKVGGFMSNWWWLSRNAANGLYKTKWFSVSPKDLEDFGYKGSQLVDNGKPGWQFVYGRIGRRLYTGFYYYKGFGEYRFGFKLLPTESDREREVGVTFIPNPFKRHKK